LISSIEYQRIPNLMVAPDIAIASRKEVRSVLILTRKDLSEVEHVALDRFSRSSVALLRILLHRRFGSRPFFLSMTPDPDAMLTAADAALIIGDSALALAPGDYQVIDLASEWFAETGLPFVFAFWAMRRSCPGPELAGMLREAKRYGLQQLPERMADIRARWPLPPEEILSYLTTNIHYDLGEEEKASLELFYRYSLEASLIDAIQPLRFA
jgi:chorismate dehydratase